MPQKHTALFILPSLLFLGGAVALLAYGVFIYKSLPRLTTLKDYHPPLTSLVLDRKGVKVGEFFEERRVLVPYQDFPPCLMQAFIAAEDGQFFQHRGLNIKAIFRAFLANLKAGRKVQGGSTITQQVARSLMLSSEKTYTRKLKEALLSLQMEKRLSKEEILYLYLNQIYLGQGAYGVGMAARTYFKKDVKNLSLKECALLAGLTQAPSRFSPIYNPKKAKQRQIYVLNRMAEEDYITEEEKASALQSPLTVYTKEQSHQKAPYYLEALNKILQKKLGGDILKKGGLSIHTAMDFDLQLLARKTLREGLKALSKRRGFPGPLMHLKSPEEIQSFLTQQTKEQSPVPVFYTLQPAGEAQAQTPILKEKYFPKEDVKAVVSEVFEEGLMVRLPFEQTGFIPKENMNWALKSQHFRPDLKLANVLKPGDVIWVKALSPFSPEEAKKLKKIKFTSPPHLLLSLEQKPVVEGALVAFDQKTGDIVALVGGYDFNRSQFNRVYQAKRSTGSVFKPIVYTAALDGGFHPASVITDAPLVYNEEEAEEQTPKPLSENTPSPQGFEEEEDTKPAEEEVKKWKPGNYGRHFSGDILLRNALIRSINIPTVKLIESLSIPWVLDYARRLGIFSPLNPDYTLALGSSSVTLYEITKVFSVFGRLGKSIHPLLIRQVLSPEGQAVLSSLSMDEYFSDQIHPFQEEMEARRQKFLSQPTPAFEEIPSQKPSAPPFFFKEEDQLISEKTAFLISSLLRAAIKEPGGTGFSARDLKWPVAGKTGTTNNYHDGWFVGYSSGLVVGVWVGFDNEQSLGQGESGARAALPVWKAFMESAHKDQDPEDFKVPEGIVFTRIDNQTGGLVSPSSKQVVVQAFVEGSQPQEAEEEEIKTLQDQDFLREGL